VLSVDAGLPISGVLADLAEPHEPPAGGDPDDLDEHPTQDEPSPARAHEYPLIENGWLRATMGGYGSAFAAQWRADPDRLLAAALDLLAELRMVATVEGGVLALPLLARYRNAVVEVRRRKAEPTLFDVGDGSV
ncbi:MAG: DUF2398 family protein, partial [Thermoleophilaceae bacterium]